MSEQYPATRDDLLARIRASRATLEAFVASVDEAGLEAPGPEGWSAKDHLYHLGAWERKVLAQLRAEPIPEALGIDRAIWESDDVDAINAAIQARSRDLPLAEALTYFGDRHQELLAELERYPEAQYGNPGYPDQPDSGPMVAYVAGNSYEHYPEHLGYIKDIVGQR